ncbi:MAG: type VI secretion system baseplate subunit TssG [Candidatus Sedimenticola sp. (ex Thyasira tokunagai)]
MAVTHRTATRALNTHDKLQEVPYEFDFYWAMRLLECVHPDNPKIGESLRPKDDPVRFGQEPSTAFAPSTISNFTPAKEGHKSRMEVLHFGLFGPNGPLPLHLTEYAKDRQHNADDRTFSRFADIFHHRMLSLFYRAWANAQPSVSFDRPQEDHFASDLGALFGLGMPSLKERDAMPDLAKLHYAGWFASQTRSADGLESIVADFFKLPTRVQQFVGNWMEIPEEGRFRLGETKDTGALGMTAIIGTRVWDRQNKFRIIMGPLDAEEYKRLLPGRDGLKRLIAIVRNYISDELHWDLNLILKKSEVPPLRLGGEGQLGWTTWMTSKPLPDDGDDLMLNPFVKAS